MNKDNSRGGTVEVSCFECGAPVVRYRSAVLGKVLCPKHRKRPVASRLEAKLDKSGGPDACWPFMGARLPDGYGSFAGCGEWRSHRVAWVIAHGPIPKGKYVLHKRHCNNPPCCNPSHLYLGDQTDNMRDMIALGRKATTSGAAHYNAKITEAMVREIRREYRYGQAKRLGEKFGIAAATVRGIGQGKSWKHVV